MWRAKRRKIRGGQPTYSDLAITVCLIFGMINKPPPCQTEGFVRSLFRLMGVDIRAPDFPTFSRRGFGLDLPLKSRSDKAGPIQLVVDSAGLKIFGEGEWLQSKYKTIAKRKSWRKSHLGLYLVTGEIVCSDLTSDGVADPTALAELLDQIDGDVSHFIVDEAYDGDPTSELLVKLFGLMSRSLFRRQKPQFSAPKLREIQPFAASAFCAICTGGRMASQVNRGYNQRSRAKTQKGRWKMVIGPKLKARSFPNKKTQAKICTHILNKMTGLGRAKFDVVA